MLLWLLLYPIATWLVSANQKVDIASTPWIIPLSNPSISAGNPIIPQKANELTDKELKALKNQIEEQEKAGRAWIHLTTECMLNGSCSFSIYDALDIRKEGRAPEQRTSVMVFIQDIILGASYFIGTVVTASLIVSGLFYVLSPTDSGYQQKASKGIKYSLIGLVVVTLALVIIRLVQFLAKWGI